MATLKDVVSPERERFLWFHWQNLNDRKDGTQGSGIRHGRCWWHFRNRRTVGFTWNMWSTFCGVEFDIDDEDVTFMVAFPPLAFWLSFSTAWRLISKLAPRKPLRFYPETIVIDEREVGIRIHGGRVWIKPWCKRNEWSKQDPWWVRGTSFSVNPVEWVHMRHEVRRLDGSWVPFVGSWESGKEPDGRWQENYPYWYRLDSGEIQKRVATVTVERRSWRPRCLRWTELFERSRVSIDVRFDAEIGERVGSWKGGTVGCAWDLLPNESPLDALRRMERERKFA